MTPLPDPLHLLNAINQAQSSYIETADTRSAFDRLLNDVLTLTASAYGFIGEVFHNQDGAPFLKTHAITNIAWNAETRAFYAANAPEGMAFTNLRTLFGAVLVTAQPVIANDPANDSRRGGLPAGHPPLRAFMGLPILHGEELVALLGLANRPDGYSQELADVLQPLLTTIGQIVVNRRNRQARLAAEAQLRQAFSRLQAQEAARASEQTSMRETEQNLQQERWRLRAILEGTHIGTWEWNIQSGETVFNERWADIVGYTLEELAPISIQTWMDLAHPEDLQRSAALLEQHFAGELDFYECESRMRHKDGHWVWVLDRGRVLEHTSDNKPLWMYGTHQDITESKRTEIALQESEARFRGIFEKANTAMAFADGAGIILFFNDMFCQLLGYEAHELPGMHFAYFTHPDDVSRELAYFEQIISGTRDDYRLEKRYLTKAGGVVWGDLAVTVIRDNTGAPLNYVGLVVNINERKLAEAALRESELRFRQFADNVGLVFWVRTAERVLYVNPAYAHIWGRTCQSLLEDSQSFIAAVHTDDRARVIEAFQREITREEEFDATYRIVRPDGAIRWIQARSYKIPVQPGEPLRWTGVAEDITERRNAEETLRQSIERFAQVAEQSREMIWEVAPDGLYTYVSQAAQELFGYAPEEMVGRMHFYDLLPEVDREALKTAVLAAFQQHRALKNLENTVVSKDGRNVIVSTNGVPIFDDRGGFIGYRGSDLDITERKQAEAALRVSERKFRGLFELSPVGIAMNDFASGAFLEANDSLLRSTGYTREEFFQLSYWDITPREYEPQEQQQLEAMQQTGRFGPYEKEYIRKSGERYPVLLNGMKLNSEDGRALIWVFIQDITERKTAEVTLRENSRHTQAILDNMIDGIATIDERGIVDSFNRAAEIIFGYSTHEIIGQKVNMLMPEPHRSRHDQYLHNYLTTGVRKIIGIGREVEGRRKNGELFPLELSVSEISRAGRPLFIGMVRDITERKRMERMKNEFISTVSHELRTPLTSISGSLGMLASGKLGDLPDRMRALVDIAYNNSRRLNTLVNDLLDMEKIAAGKMHLNMQPLDLLMLVKQAMEANHAYGLEHGSHFRLVEAADAVTVSADTDRLLQVLANLLSNAAKFSPAGADVELRVQRRGHQVRVSVTDRGSGVPAEFQKRIFQKFSQADSSDTRKKGGTGLGLSIAKELVDRMGGRIGFVSPPGQGSTFYFDLPEHQQSPAPEISPKAPRLLVVEDDADTANLLAMMLQQAGFNTDVALNGRQALQLLAQKHYAAMTLDLILPDMNGVAIIRHVRNQAELTRLPIVVVSARVEEGQLAVNGEFQAVNWLEKPVNETRLVAALRSALPNGQDARSHVLHVEDNPDLAHIMALLGQSLAVFHTASTLKEARAMLTEYVYTVVVLDLNLPDGSGWDLLPSLRALRPQPKIIVLSATELTREEAGQVEASLIKSRASNRQLVDTLKELLHSTRT